ncbi:hypothetical protein [Denitrobaculum tricleocarpae]|uniref:Uncharacterized protein n=1 Tax=Denitrobaculum tricleocarpae TaxID=2591009 RepID=A0A545TQW9_9PROT|nr:hypothetical protein [Denitrobaculum tricleocarpae]TQV79616.1 hypothetical protein FKG95_12895 [Denitrobaculum tricleocarpae]
MKIANDPKRVLPVIAGKIRGLAEPVVRELEGVRPARAPEARTEPKARSKPAQHSASEAASAKTTLTGWSTKDLMTAVRQAIKSGRAVARGRFLNIRI